MKPEEFNRQVFPPGGWQFYQPQTGWSAPTPISSTFDQTVVLIIKHRQKNPQLGLAVDPFLVATELEFYNRSRLGLPASNAPPKTQPRGEKRKPLAAVAVEVRLVAQGAKGPLEWLASGRAPVPPAQAAVRASKCLGCKKNDTEGGLTKWFTVPAAEKIRQALERRHDLKLETPYDEALGICMACYCPLKCKVHEPLDLVLKNTSQEVRDRLWEECWILNETPTPDNPGGH